MARFNIQSITHQVVSGPSREGLFDALRLFTEDRTIEITYLGKCQEAIKLPVHVSAIEAEDGSGWSWNCKGWYGSGELDGNVEFYCNTNTRKGWIKFLPS